MSAAPPRTAPASASPARTRTGTGTRPRVAVIGSGLAGLTTAYLLVREGADVWLIDKAPRLGFHAWSVELDAPTPVPGGGTVASTTTPSRKPRLRHNALALDLDPSSSPSPSLSPIPSPSLKSALARRASGRARAPSNDDNTLAVDVPMRSFQGGYYPLLIALYRHLGIPLQPAHFTFSFSALPPQPDRAVVRARATRPIADDTYFIHSGASGASLPSLPSAAWRSPFSFVQAVTALLSVAVCYAILIVLSLVTWHGLIPASTTFRTLVDTVSARLEQPHRRLPRTPLGRAFRAFATDIVLPLFSAVGTMTAEDVWDTRASVLLDYIHAGMGTSHYVLGNGHSARDVARLLADPVRAQGRDRVRLGTAIRTLKYRPADAGARPGEIVLSLEGGDELAVDRVVVATQASTARALLATLEPSLLMHGAKAEARRVSRMHTALADVQYRDTIVVTHRDASVLPAGADVRDINLVQPGGAGTAVPKPKAEPYKRRSSESDAENELVAPALTPAASDSSAQTSPCPTPRTLPPSLGVMPYFDPSGPVYTMATHVIAPGPGVAPVLQTTNPVVPVDADSVLGVARLERALPLRDDRTLVGLRPAPEAGDKEKAKEAPLVYLAGSYAYPGIPLLEGCVGSARRAVEDMLGKGLMPQTGGVDWAAGQGSLVGRVWRWRWRGRGGY